VTSHPDASDRLLRCGRLLEWVTLLWNVVAVAVLAVLAVSASSVALTGFGLDSLIEIGASSVVLWELAGTGEERQKKALRLIGCAFIALGVYLLVQSTAALMIGHHAETSVDGIIWTAVTAVVMFSLAAGKRRTGRALDNPVLETESQVTFIDGLLAVAVLVGISVNALAGWWWADPLVGYAHRVLRLPGGRPHLPTRAPLTPAWADALLATAAGIIVIWLLLMLVLRREQRRHPDGASLRDLLRIAPTSPLSSGGSRQTGQCRSVHGSGSARSCCICSRRSTSFPTSYPSWDTSTTHSSASSPSASPPERRDQQRSDNTDPEHRPVPVPSTVSLASCQRRGSDHAGATQHASLDSQSVSEVDVDADAATSASTSAARQSASIHTWAPTAASRAIDRASIVCAPEPNVQ
jgi:hypothetical protein